MLYELYAGRTPFDVASQPLRSPYQIKASARPAALAPRVSADVGLVEAIIAGLYPNPRDREDMGELLGRIRAWRNGERFRGTRRTVTRRAAIGMGVAGLSFLMRTPMAQRATNDGSRLGGWEQSSLRAWMADELPELLPSELVSNVVAVDKLTNNAGAARDASAITTTSDTFWVPSMSELCGYQGPETFSEEYAYLSALYSGEGNQYRLFYELGISGLTANERLVRRVDGQPVYWWERTPSADGSEGAASTAFNRVMTDGDAFDGATPGDARAEDTYVFPGFCF